MICYENLFGDELRKFWSSGDRAPNLLVVSSNLAWFSDFIQFQHLQFSKARALEMARPVVSVNNNGSSAVIDEQGSLLLTVPKKAFQANAVVTTRSGPPTVFALTGNIPALILALCALILASAGRIFKTKAA